MANSFSFGKVELVESTEAAELPTEVDPQAPFRILVLGDFSGRANRGIRDDGGGPLVIDRDNFDQVMARLGVELRLPVEGEDDARIVLRFKELDDFHPDQIFAQAEVFEALRETRRRLLDPSTFAATAGRLGGQAPARRASIDETVGAILDTTPPSATPSPADLLDQILAQTAGMPPPAPAPRKQEGHWDTFLERITAAHRVAGSDPRQAEMVASVDSATSQLMRDILHHADFQALEAAWRGLHFLTRRLDTDATLKLAVLDRTRGELAADLDEAPDLRSTRLAKLLSAPSPGPSAGPSWGVLIGNLTFEPDPADIALLGRLAGVARLAGTPFLAAASPRMLGCESLAATPDPVDWRLPLDAEARTSWELLRRQPEASWLGLALPRFLLRAPYGKDENAIESFDFEEVGAEARDHESLLWGNPAFALAELLGRSFSVYGWEMRPGVLREVDGLPLHVDRRGDETELTPCAEALVSDRTVEKILDAGLMPLLSIRGRDAVAIARFQSIGDPPTPLSGRWG